MSESECKHDVLYKSRCTACATLLSEKEVIEIGYCEGRSGVMLSKKAAQQSDTESREKMISKRKLCMMLDLDQTILHATNDPRAEQILLSEDALAKEGLYRVRIPNPGGHGRAVDVVHYIKLRPGVREFLAQASQLYDIFISTQGARAYAEAVAKLVDPDSDIFRHRTIFSREDQGVRFKSTARLFPADDRCVLVVDDRADVWQHARNLVRVAPYRFWTLSEVNVFGQRQLPIPQSFPEEIAPVAGVASGTVQEPPSCGSTAETNVGDETTKLIVDGPFTMDGDQALAEQRTTDQSTPDQLTSAQPMADQPAADQHTTKQVMPDHFTTGQLMASTLTTDQLATMQTMADLTTDQLAIRQLLSDPVAADQAAAGRLMSNPLIAGWPTVEPGAAAPESDGCEASDDGSGNSRRRKLADEHPTSQKRFRIPRRSIRTSSPATNSGLPSTAPTVDNATRPLHSAPTCQQPATTTDSVGPPEERCDDRVARESASMSTCPEAIWGRGGVALREGRDDRHIWRIAAVVSEVHTYFYEGIRKNNELAVDECVAAVRRQVLRGVQVAFSGLWPTGRRNEEQAAWRLAASLGATPTADARAGDTTHVVAASLGSDKSRIAGAEVVRIGWLYRCAETWTRVPEAPFRICRSSDAELERRAYAALRDHWPLPALPRVSSPLTGANIEDEQRDGAADVQGDDSGGHGSEPDGDDDVYLEGLDEERDDGFSDNEDEANIPPKRRLPGSRVATALEEPAEVNSACFAAHVSNFEPCKGDTADEGNAAEDSDQSFDLGLEQG